MDSSIRRRDEPGREVLTIGVVTAPVASTFFVAKRDADAAEGVTVTLGRQLAAYIGAEPQIVAFPNSGELTDALEAGAIDVGFMPVDDERRRRVAFGPSYFLIESTAMARTDGGFASVSDLNRPGIKVVGIANTTTIRSAQRVLTDADVISAPSVDAALAALKGRQCDAIVLSRDVLDAYARDVPEFTVLQGSFQSTGIAIAVPLARYKELGIASRFLEEAKASGVVRAAFDAAGFAAAQVAPREHLSPSSQQAGPIGLHTERK